jgi:hypothetical protein
VKTYQDAVLEAMEDVVTSFKLETTIHTPLYANEGVLFAGTPFSIVAQAAYGFQLDRTTIRFNGANLGNANSFRWSHDETRTALSMLKRWRELIEAGLHT